MSWGCPFDAGGECQRVVGRACDPGMLGCILYGRVKFSVEEKNSPSSRREAERRIDHRDRRSAAADYPRPMR